eukprot:6167523-Amphidinium_carterae.1
MPLLASSLVLVSMAAVWTLRSYLLSMLPSIIAPQVAYVLDPSLWMQPLGTCTSIESASSSSSMHVDGSANAYQPGQSYYCYWQHYGYSYVDQYEEIYVPVSQLEQACGTNVLDHPVSFRLLGGLDLELWLDGAYHLQSVQDTVGAAGDIRDVWHIIVTACCDTVLVLSIVEARLASDARGEGC